MEVVMDNVRQYILALKEAGNFSNNDIANLSGVPIETIRNILSGKTAKKRRLRNYCEVGNLIRR